MMQGIVNGLFAIALVMFGLLCSLIGIYNALWASVNEQRVTNGISKRMAKMMESE